MLRTFLLVCALLAISSPLHAQTWTIAKATNPLAGTTIIYRYVSTFKPGFVRTGQPVRIIITWPYKGNKGMPSAAEQARMEELENALEPIEADGVANLVLVSTGNDLKEWTYYVQSEQAFLAHLNARLGAKPALPIEIHVGNDAAWTTYDEFVGRVKQ